MSVQTKLPVILKPLYAAAAQLHLMELFVDVIRTELTGNDYILNRSFLMKD